MFRGVARILHWGAQKLSAEGARIEAPKAPRGVPIGEVPNRLRVLGSVVSSPSEVPGRQRIFGIFEVHRTLLVERTVPTNPFFPLKNDDLVACPPPAAWPLCPSSSEYAPGDVAPVLLNSDKNSKSTVNLVEVFIGF